MPFPQLPPGSRFGTADSADQVEGALDADGRGRSIWEEFAERPGAVLDGSSASVAAGRHGRLDEDLALLKGLGVRAHRFSIAWPRVQPTGRGGSIPVASRSTTCRRSSRTMAAGSTERRSMPSPSTPR